MVKHVTVYACVRFSSAAGIDFPSTAVATMAWAVVAVVIVFDPVYSYLSF